MLIHLRFCRTLGVHIAVAILFVSVGFGVAQDTLRIASDVPVQLDPAFAASDAEIAVLNTIYDYLVDIDSNNNIAPRLATSWEVSDDGLSYTFNLAEGVTFHDGSPLTASDVVWTYDRLRDPALELPTADLYANIASIDALDDTTVSFSLTETNPFFLYDLSDNHAFILKAETADPAADFNGSGPFVVSDYSPENRMSLTANESYFIEGKPGVDALEFIFFSDQAASVDALRGGQVDIVLNMPLALYETLDVIPGVTAVSVPSNGFDLVRLRADRAPGNDPRVIEAFKLAVDREAIFELVKNGIGALGQDSPIGPLYDSYYAAELTPTPRDPARARELLAEAGYADGLELTLHTPDSGDRPDLAVVLQQQLEEAGFVIDISVEPESVYYGENGWLEVDLGITGWGSRPLPQFYLDVMVICGARWNEAKYCNEDVDALASTAGTTLDEAARIDAYQQIQAILLESAPFVIPYFFAETAAHAENVVGFDLQAFVGRTDFAAISLQ
ncbi:MAG: ABC transporter substrate-binding protein [Deinococcota bacterium]